MAEDEKVTAGDAIRAGQAAARLAEGDVTALKDADALVKVGKQGAKYQVFCCGYLAAFAVFIMVFSTCTFTGSCDSADALEPSTTSNWTGSADTVAELDGARMPATSGKIGHEQHASKQSCFAAGNVHYNGPLSFFDSIGSVSNCMAFGGPMTTDQERWYFNMRWYTGSGYPGNVKHKKVIITNPANGKRIVASIEEYGPAAYLMTRDGINSGASPEVYKYLELTNPYTGNPSDKSGFAEYGFAVDQNIPLGPLN
jgi:hypothetical protein